MPFGEFVNLISGEKFHLMVAINATEKETIEFEGKAINFYYALLILSLLTYIARLLFCYDG